MKWLSLLLLPVFSVLGATSSPPTLALGDALRLAQESHPEIAAAKARETAAQESVNSLSARYFPSIGALAVDSVGYPGAPGDMVPGIIGSPFRKGPGAELYGKWTLFDFTRSPGIEAARFGLQSQQEKTETIRMRLYQEVLNAYLEAARDRGNQETWEAISRDIVKFKDHVKSFVRGGQYSDVARLLLEDQASEAEMKADVFGEKYQTALQKVALLTGTGGQAFSCPPVGSLDEKVLSVIRPGNSSPVTRAAMAEMKSAQAATSRYFGEYLPKLVAVGSIGLLSDSRLVDRNFYSGWIGISVPLFDGSLISSEVHKANAEALEKEKTVSSVNLGLQQASLEFDGRIRVSRKELTHLAGQRAAALKAWELAKSRYLSFVGTLVDLREALRNLGRIESQINDAQAEFLIAQGSKLFLNGGSLATESR